MGVCVKQSRASRGSHGAYKAETRRRQRKAALAMLIGVFQGLKHWLGSKGVNGRQKRIVGDLGGRRAIP
jgi:hypothetical protein